MAVNGRAGERVRLARWSRRRAATTFLPPVGIRPPGFPDAHPRVPWELREGGNRARRLPRPECDRELFRNNHLLN